MKIKISPAAIAILAFALVLDESGRAFLLFVSLFFHELFHILAMKVCRRKIAKINVKLPALEITCCPSVRGYSSGSSAFIALAGPAANLLLAALSLAFIGWNADYFRACNLSLAAVNLLALKGNDGYFALEAVLSAHAGKRTAGAILRVLDMLSLILLWAFSVCAMLTYSNNLSPLILCVFVFASISERE